MSLTLAEIKVILNANVLTSKFDANTVIGMAYSADLMSDVLSFSQTDSLLITGLVDKTVVRTAHVANIKAIVFARGKVPNKDTVALADEKNIPLMITNFSKYESCGRLYEKGLRNSYDAK
ncbi:MAG: hypothetical protein A2X54_00560 [Nitrospirae bacterium GWF2_44_13]|nr:MAG: hypothetical protein A2X54_00560 [Nitrospirae bacterium GWF2_44_13]OGW34865.1 MAG: hypothetical protein A2088_05510 [Nitrospirae bacterium GWD2_44_7]OGW66385.1 MAG: hypothetical protein A2222_01220 [Nitrospirae bacterium RIFOXYA2_FULL_44_9]OGW72971.1 MAG: hypothetical protein A2484_00165 [Nitrospirae bacterium RIFOXYC2_FULL_44_7]HBG92667.1 transcriptional regulator [Nitrospiraceae bacterium]